LTDINGSALKSILAKKGLRLNDASRKIGLSKSYIGMSCRLNRMSYHAINQIETKLGIPSEDYVVTKKAAPAPEASPAPEPQAAPPENTPDAYGGKMFSGRFNANDFLDIDSAALKRALEKASITMSKASLQIGRNDTFIHHCCTRNRIRVSAANLLETKVGIPKEAYVINALSAQSALPTTAVHSQIDLEAIKPIIDYAIEQLRGLLSHEGVLFK